MLILARRPRAVLGVRDSGRSACAVLLRVVVWCALEEPESRRVSAGPCNKLGPRARLQFPNAHNRPACVTALAAETVSAHTIHQLHGCMTPLTACARVHSVGSRACARRALLFRRSTRSSSSSGSAGDFARARFQPSRVAGPAHPGDTALELLLTDGHRAGAPAGWSRIVTYQVPRRWLCATDACLQWATTRMCPPAIGRGCAVSHDGPEQRVVVRNSGVINVLVVVWRLDVDAADCGSVVDVERQSTGGLQPGEPGHQTWSDLTHPCGLKLSQESNGRSRHPATRVQRQAS